MAGSKSLKYPLHSKSCYLSLACSIGSISLACGSLLQIPNTTDRISLQRGLFLTSLGFIYFVSLTDFCNKYLLGTQQGIKFRKKYRLMMSDVMEITNKIVSAIQAFFSFLVGFIVCKSTCSKSFVYASHFLMEAYAWFGTAYFMYDIWAMYQVHTQKISDKLKLIRMTSNSHFMPKAINGQPNGGLYDKHIAKTFGVNGKRLPTSLAMEKTNDKNNISGSDSSTPVDEDLYIRHHEDEIYDYDGESVQIPKDGKWDFFKYILTHPLMIIHHIFIGTFGLLVVTYIRGGGHCIYSYMFMMEFSTPFVSMRGLLSTLGLKDTQAYIVNGLLMLATFFLFRVFMWPYVMYRYSVAINTTFWQSVMTLPRGCIISILILFLPQLYWFFLMVKGALKVFFPKAKPIDSQKQQHTDDMQINPQSKNNNLSPVVDNTTDFHQNGEAFLKNGNGVNGNVGK